MRTHKIEVPLNPQSLKTLLREPIRHTKNVGLQAPKTNKGTIFFGDQQLQAIELRPKSNGLLPITTFEAIYIKGTRGDMLNIVLFDQ